METQTIGAFLPPPPPPELPILEQQPQPEPGANAEANQQHQQRDEGDGGEDEREDAQENARPNWGKFNKMEWHNLLKIVESDLTLIGKPKALFLMIKKPGSGITVPATANARDFQQKWNTQKKYLVDCAQAFVTENGGEDWSDGSDAFDLAYELLGRTLASWPDKYHCPRLAWFIAHHCWLAKHSKHAKKQKNEIAENLMNVGDRHLDDGLGGKRGKISKDDREKHHDRLKKEGTAKKDTKANYEKRYAKFASGSESKRKAEIQKRKYAKAALEAGARNGGEMDDDEDEEDDDEDEDEVSGSTKRKLQEREAANKRMKAIRQASSTPLNLSSSSNRVAARIHSSGSSYASRESNRLDQMETSINEIKELIKMIRSRTPIIYHNNMQELQIPSE